MPSLRLQYHSRTVPMRDLQYADPLDIEVPEGSTVQVLDVTPVGQEYRIQFVVATPGGRRIVRSEGTS